MKLRYTGLIIALVGFALVYYFNREKVQLFSHGNFELKKISATGLECCSELRLDNPNLLSATILAIDETYRLNGVAVAKLNHEPQQAIPGRKTSIIPVAVRFSADVVSKDWPQKSLLTVSGIIKYKSMFGEGEIPVHISDTVLIPGL